MSETAYRMLLPANCKRILQPRVQPPALPYLRRSTATTMTTTIVPTPPDTTAA